MNIANEVRALIEATKKCLGPRPCDFRLLSHQENQSLTKEEQHKAQKENTPILIKKHDGSFTVYGKRPRAVWRERSLKDLTEDQRKALTDLDFTQSMLTFDKDLSTKQILISALQKGHPATIYEQSLMNSFQNLLYEGIPELKEAPFYYPIYEMCATEQEVPLEKKPGYIYLYIKDEKLHYQTQWSVDPGPIEQPPVLKGIIPVEARLLQEVQFVDSPVKAGDPIRTLWHMADGQSCIYACISDNQQVKVGAISITSKCNLFLCDILEESVPSQLIETAQKQQAPVLIRRRDKFSIYGQIEGVWQERALENLHAAEQGLLRHLDFEKSILYANEIEDNLTDILRKGHGEVGDTPHSIRDKLLIELKNKQYCLSQEKNLDNLKGRIGEYICNSANHMQPFYENSRPIPSWHNEILKLETGFLTSAEELLKILDQESFNTIFGDDPEVKDLINNLKNIFAQVFLSQKRIVACLREFKDPSQLIDQLKEAYGAGFDAVLYSEMALLLSKFDQLLKDKYGEKIKDLFKGNADVNSPRKLLHFLVKKNLTVRFGSQYLSRRPLLFTSFAEFFRQGHPKFAELVSVYSAVNKSAVAANRAQEGYFEDRVRSGEEDPHHQSFTDLMLIVNKEKDPYKKINLELIQPLLAFLILDTQNASEKSREKNDAAIFYLQRRMLIDRVQKFIKEWSLSEEVSSVAHSALGMLISSGYKILKLELNGNELRYIIRLREDPVTEIRGSIASKELQRVGFQEKLDVEDASSMANILWIIARKGHIPPPLNDDSILLVKAVRQIIDILSPEKCSFPENIERVRRGRLQPGLEKRPKSSMDSPEPSKNMRHRTLSGLFSEVSSSSVLKSLPEMDRVQLVSPLTSGEGSLSTSPVGVEPNLSISPLKVGPPSTHSSGESPGDSSSISPESAHSLFFSSLVQLEECSPLSRVNKEEIERLRASIYRTSFFTSRIDLENMKQLCALNDFNGFYQLAAAAKDGKHGIPQDRVAAFYLNCLAESNIASVKNQDKAKIKVEILSSHIGLPSPEAKCDAFFKEKLGFDPKEKYLIAQTTTIQKRLQGPA